MASNSLVEYLQNEKFYNSNEDEITSRLFSQKNVIIFKEVSLKY
jgi:hypothetical protein